MRILHSTGKEERHTGSVGGLSCTNGCTVVLGEELQRKEGGEAASAQSVIV